MMHKDTIDWIREINISADTSLAKKYWGTAKKIGENVDREKLINLLRLFLFEPRELDFSIKFTSEIRTIDGEFKGRDNIAEVRLIAGLVMISTFEEPSYIGDAFALGLRAANFSSAQSDNFLPSINQEAERYLQIESNRFRPDQFSDDTKTSTVKVIECKSAFEEASEDEIESTRDALQIATADAFVAGYGNLSKRIEQLAEESGLLWWVLNEYSDLLKKPVSELSQQSFSLVAAAEAAMRTRLLPPPHCIAPLLARALKHCKTSKKQLLLTDYLKSTNAAWRKSQMKSLAISDCFDLVPLCTALAKFNEFEDVDLAMQALPRFCPGVSGDLSLSPFQVTHQFYNEVIFVRSLDAL